MIISIPVSYFLTRHTHTRTHSSISVFSQCIHTRECRAGHVNVRQDVTPSYQPRPAVRRSTSLEILVCFFRLRLSLAQPEWPAGPFMVICENGPRLLSTFSKMSALVSLSNPFCWTIYNLEWFLDTFLLLFGISSLHFDNTLCRVLFPQW